MGFLKKLPFIENIKNFSSGYVDFCWSAELVNSIKEKESVFVCRNGSQCGK